MQKSRTEAKMWHALQYKYTYNYSLYYYFLKTLVRTTLKSTLNCSIFSKNPIRSISLGGSNDPIQKIQMCQRLQSELQKILRTESCDLSKLMLLINAHSNSLKIIFIIYLQSKNENLVFLLTYMWLNLEQNYLRGRYLTKGFPYKIL